MIKSILLKIKRIFVYLLVSLIYILGCLCYDRRFLIGSNFDRHHFSIGWTWILRYWFSQKILRINSHVPFPVPGYAMIANSNNIEFNPDDMRMFHVAGSYFQGIGGKIRLGSPIYIAPGVGIITANHDLNNLSVHKKGEDVYIGNNSWIGMNAVILPGVKLGDHTIVGAGAVVTKSFPEGNCLIAGNPAKIIRKLDFKES